MRATLDSGLATVSRHALAMLINLLLPRNNLRVPLSQGKSFSRPIKPPMARPQYGLWGSPTTRVMMKKKLVSACLLFAGVIAFCSTDANARPLRHHLSLHRAHHAHASHHARRFVRHPYAHRRGAHFARHGRARVAHRGGRPRAWCGWWLGNHLGIGDRKLWLARNWASVGHNAGGPRVGAVVVWPHHVGIITGRAAGKWIVKSGNDGHTVRERPRSIAGAIAFRAVSG